MKHINLWPAEDERPLDPKASRALPETESHLDG